MAKYDVYGVGAALLDTELAVSDEDLAAQGVAKGLMTLIDEERRGDLLAAYADQLGSAKLACGGSAGNSVIANSYFGGRSFFSCLVAADDDGDRYLRELRRAGVEHPSKAQSVGAGATGSCLVLITDDAERSMSTCLGISAEMGPEQIDEAALGDSAWLYLEGYTAASPTNLNAALRACEVARARGTRIALSFSDPGIASGLRDELRRIIGDGVDLIFCNEDEALAWSERDDLEAAGRALGQVSASHAITCGARGALLCDTASQLRQVAAPTTRPVDTNGAGDMFAGAFLHALTQGHAFETAGAFACRAASRLVECFGPRFDSPAQYRALAAELKQV